MQNKKLGACAIVLALPLSACITASNGIKYGGEQVTPPPGSGPLIPPGPIKGLPIPGEPWGGPLRMSNGEPPAPPPPAAAPEPPPPPPPPPCQAPAPGQPINMAGCKTGDVIVLHGVNFDFDKATIDVNGQSLLNQVADALQARPDIKIEIDGHTDGKGSVRYNQRLSDRRAASVRLYLISRGIDSGRMTAKGFGKSMPIADNATDEGRALNRRVELKITASNDNAVSVSPPAGMTAPAAAPASAGGAVSISNSAFAPATITVTAGTTVTWTNNDNIAHIVKFPDQASPSLAPGASYSLKFAQAGEFAYQCGIHPFMSGLVVVK